MNINFFMKKAINQAKEAILINEVPIGAILVDNINDTIIDFSHNFDHFNLSRVFVLII